MTVNEKILFDSLKQAHELISNIVASSDVATYVAENSEYIEIVQSDVIDALATIDHTIGANCEGSSCSFSLT
ncbi:MAG: hypothetical protein ACP5U1_10045 [Desulfomonilaceae bacterium]